MEQENWICVNKSWAPTFPFGVQVEGQEDLQKELKMLQEEPKAHVDFSVYTKQPSTSI